ncbi:MAG: transcriptional regulator [Armatimonadetes bacterium RBG_16_58_9]|nr:MAG: transcriptional regulator [Armatimonadetes bacterium RBG_16_58_9]
MAIPLVNLKAQNLALKDEIAAAVLGVLDSGQFILGPNVSALEEEVAPICQAEFGVTVNSGTDAIVIAFAACGIGSGDEVITTPFTFVATTEAIMIVGAKPVYVDIEADTFNLDPNKIEEKITDKTKAILPVHLYGQCADIERIESIARKHGLKLVSDGAQAIGAKHKGKGIGAYGDAATLSFYPTKNLGGCGDGGMVLTDSEETAKIAKSLRSHGTDSTYSYERVGYCSRMDELQAAVLRVKLAKISEWNESRRSNAAVYVQHLSDLPLKLPISRPENYHVYHQFTVRFERRDELKAKLAEREIGSAIFYPSPLHLQRAYANLGYKPGDLPDAEKASAEVLSLPIFPELTHKELIQVAAAVREAVMELA